MSEQTAVQVLPPSKIDRPFEKVKAPSGTQCSVGTPSVAADWVLRIGDYDIAVCDACLRRIRRAVFSPAEHSKP